MEDYSFEILSEKVADFDLFEGKTHENSANNIHKIISSSPVAVTIGLEGVWGSGKSTVVNLLKNKLEADAGGTLVYLFDAWAHDGDPLRRIFLEGLIDQFDPERQNAEIQCIKAEISGRKKSVSVRTKKSTSTLGGWLSFSAIFVPLGAALLSAIDYKTVAWFSSDMGIHWLFWLALAATLAPLLILALWGIFSDDVPEKSNRKLFARKRWDLFESESEESYTQDITEDGERTSIEFEYYFRQIMSCAIGDNKKYHRALVVIDNLDRIEPEQTLAIWSILQTFFQYRSQSGSFPDNWRDKLWFLIPYDREGLSKVWGRDDKQVESSLGIESGDSQRVRNAGNGTAEAFLEKCFQLVEEVPEPVLTSWVEYCELCVQKSLTGWPETGRTVVVDTFKRYESSLSISPTPRQIQSFVNKVGMLGLRWGPAVNPEALALYALVRRNRSERQLRAELLAPGLPDSYQAHNEADLKAELCGLLFGVDKDRGMQLLLGPEIAAALKDGNAEKIAQLIEQYGEAFWVVWQSTKAATLPSGHTEEYRIAVTIALCKGAEQHINRVSHEIDDLVGEWEKTAHKWELSDHSYAEALSALVSVLKERKGQFIEWLDKQVRKELSAIVASIGTDKSREAELKEVRLMQDLLKESGFTVKRYFYQALDHKKWMAWMDTMDKVGVQFPEVLPDKAAIPSMIDSLDAVNAGGDISDYLLRTMKSFEDKEYWIAIGDKLSIWASNPGRATNLDAPYRLLAKSYVKSDKSGKEKIRAILPRNEFIQVVSREVIEQVPSLAAFIAIVYGQELLNKPIPTNVSQFFASESVGEKIMSGLVDSFVYCRSVHVIWELARDENNKLVVSLIRDGNDQRLYAVDSAAFYFDEYEWASDQDLKFLVDNLISSGAFDRVKEDYLEEPELYGECFGLIFKFGGDFGKDFIADVIPKITADGWINSFKNESSLFNLIPERGNHEYKDAVKKYAAEALRDSGKNKYFWLSLGEISGRLPDRLAVVFFIANEYFSLPEDPFSDEVFIHVAECLSECEIENIDSDKIMERIELWISAGQWERISWLQRQKFSVSEKPSESLVSRLQSIRTNDPGYQVAIGIAEAYRIEIPVAEEADSEAE